MASSRWWISANGGRRNRPAVAFGWQCHSQRYPPAERSTINTVLRESIRYGLAHRVAGVAHAMPLARGMDTELADRFIGMYVNDYTLDYGDIGRASDSRVSRARSRRGTDSRSSRTGIRRLVSWPRRRRNASAFGIGAVLEVTFCFADFNFFRNFVRLLFIICGKLERLLPVV